MIRIKVNDTEIPLPERVEIVREFESTIIERQQEEYDFTYPIEVPLTDEAMVALGLPHILASSQVQREYAAEMIIDGVFINNCTLKVIRTDVNRRVCTVSIIGDYGSFGREIFNKYVNELTLGGIRTIGGPDTANRQTCLIDQGTNHAVFVDYTPCDTANHMKDVATGATVTDYVFYPAVDEGLNVTGPLHEPGYGYDNMLPGAATPPPDDAPTVRNLINQWYYNNSSDNGFIDPILMYIETYLANDWQTNDRYWWVPFFRLKFVLEHCFTELGYTVSGDILSDTKFNKITLYNTYAINECSLSESVITPSGAPTNRHYIAVIEHKAHTIDPRNHVPKMKIVDFLLEMGKMFNLQYVISYTDKTVLINNLNNIGADLDTADIIDMTKYISPNFQIVHEKTDFQKGYKFSFVPDGNDPASNGDVKDDLSKYVYAGNALDYDDLGSISSPSANDLAYVHSENAWYLYGGSEWYFYSHNLGIKQTATESGLVDLQVKINPLPMKIHKSLSRIPQPYAPISTDIFSSNVPVDLVQGKVAPFSSLGIEGKNLLIIYYNKGSNLPSTMPVSAIADQYLGRTFYIRSVALPPYQPHVCNWMGMATDHHGALYSTPYGATNYYDGGGLLQDVYPLCWENGSGAGLYADRWQQFCDVMKKSMQVETEMLLDINRYKNIDWNRNYIQYLSHFFLLRKGSFTLNFPGISKTTLIRI